MIPRWPLFVTPLWCLVAAVPASAQSPFTEHTLRADDGAPRPHATLASVAWLPGHWTGEGLGALAEESWLPAAGGAMAGVFRLVDGDAVRFYELVTLVEEAGSLVMRLKHFHPDLVGWEEREATVDFPLVRLRADTLWFDGLTMARGARGDAMKIWVALEQAGGVTSEALFTYRRRTSGDGPG